MPTTTQHPSRLELGGVDLSDYVTKFDIHKDGASIFSSTPVLRSSSEMILEGYREARRPRDPVADLLTFDIDQIGSPASFPRHGKNQTILDLWSFSPDDAGEVWKLEEEESQ